MAVNTLKHLFDIYFNYGKLKDCIKDALETGKFQVCFKTANLIPMLKKDESTVKENYRQSVCEQLINL